MRIYIPHPFYHHDNYFCIDAKNTFMLIPWYSKFKDEDMKLAYDVDIYDNYAGWLWFTITWYSSK